MEMDRFRVRRWLTVAAVMVIGLLMAAWLTVGGGLDGVRLLCVKRDAGVGNDGTFRVSPSGGAWRRVQRNGPPGPLAVGVRSGSLPARCRLALGSARHAVDLLPNTQRIVDMTPRTWRRAASGDAEAETFRLVLQVRASVGDVWITVLAGDGDKDGYGLFGGAEAPTTNLSRAIALQEKASAAGSLHGAAGERTLLQAGGEATDTMRFPPEGLGLPAGVYALECSVIGLTERTVLEAAVEDAGGFPALTQEGSGCVVSSGVQTVRFALAKTFAPHQGRIRIVCREGRGLVGEWTLRPDRARTLAGWKEWDSLGRRPAWLARYPGEPLGVAPREDMSIRFGGALRLEYFSLPAAIRPGQPCPVYCGLRPVSRLAGRWLDDVVIVSFVGAGDREVHAVEFPVRWAVAALEPVIPAVSPVLSDLPAGEYDVQVGVAEDRASPRLRLDGSDLSARERRRRTVTVQQTRMAE